MQSSAAPKYKMFFLLILFVCLFLLPLYGRTLLEARKWLDLAKEDLGKKDFAQAIISYRKAISWNSPFNHYSAKAKDELYELAVNGGSGAVEEPLTLDLKLEALRELRSGLMSARNFLGPSKKLLEELKEKEANVVAEIEKQNNSSQSNTGIIREINPPRVNYLFQILAQLMFWSWIVSVMIVIWRGVTADGVFNRGFIARGTAIAVVFYVFWLLALSQA